VALLCAQGADLEAPDKTGRRPIHLICGSDDLRDGHAILTKLIEHG
jgi:hypothetical protein